MVCGGRRHSSSHRKEYRSLVIGQAYSGRTGRTSGLPSVGVELIKTGYGAGDESIASTVAFILSKQSPDGSWDGVDLTAAAIQALTSLRSIPGVAAAIERAQTL